MIMSRASEAWLRRAAPSLAAWVHSGEGNFVDIRVACACPLTAPSSFPPVERRRCGGTGFPLRRCLDGRAEEEGALCVTAPSGLKRAGFK